jgi:hypothetical protein
VATHSTHHDSSAAPAGIAPDRRTLIVSIVGFIAVVAVAITAWKFWPQRLPPADASAVELVKFCTTDQFANLAPKQQEQYVESLMNQGFPVIIAAAQQAGLTKEERQKGLENAMQAGMNVRWGKHLDTWLKLDAKGKAEYVKKVVAQMPPRPPGMDPRGANRNNRFMTPERQKRFIEGMSPDRRAGMAEFMAQIRAAHGDGGR